MALLDRSNHAVVDSQIELVPDRAEPKTFHIGELATMVGLSIRTIRHYDELGLVVPSARTAGGFRLYTDADADRFLFVKKLKPLGFSLEEVQQLVAALDEFSRGSADVRVREQLEQFAAMAEERYRSLCEQLRDAELVASSLRRRLEPSEVDAR